VQHALSRAVEVLILFGESESEVRGKKYKYINIAWPGPTGNTSEISSFSIVIAFNMFKVS
jgi:hypothetical protein